MSNHKRHTGKRNNKAGLIVACVLLTILLAVLIAVAVMLTVSDNTEIPQPTETYHEVHSQLTVEAGSASVNPERFLKEAVAASVSFKTELTKDQLATPGTYPVVLVIGEDTYNVSVKVTDTVAPTGKTVNLTTEGEMPAAEDFITDIQDVCPVSVSYKVEPDVTVAGEQEVILVLTDTSGNKTELTAVLNVDLDLTAPVITGAADLMIYQGDAVSYRSGITVTDDRDESPRLSVDSSEADLSTPGSYTVVYIATDAAGNESRVEITITVREKQPYYVDLEVIYEEVDKLLPQVVGDASTKREQVEAIYAWMYENLYYKDSSDKSDYLQGAYVMMTQRQGDCFNYYSLAKLMFDRLGIDNIDVRKVKNYEGDADHFWSLVSLDGGETWYHFDATPRSGLGDEFCLVTDAFLDAYSKTHSNSHNRDTSLYPATPEN